MIKPDLQRAPECRATALSIEGFGKLDTSPAAPIATGRSENCRVGLHPTEDRRLLHGAPVSTVRHRCLALLCAFWHSAYLARVFNPASGVVGGSECRHGESPTRRLFWASTYTDHLYTIESDLSRRS